jgi:outer membrane protein TolC
MKFLIFPVAATIAAPIKSAWIKPFRALTQESNAIRRLARAIGLATLAGALAFSGLVSGAEAPLTLPEAQRRAVERSHQIPAQDAAITASREMAVAAGRLPDPVLKLGIDNLPINGPDQFSVQSESMTQRYIGVMQEFTRSEKRQLRAQRFEGEAEKSLAEKAAMIAAIQRDTALAWFDRYYSEALVAVITQQAAAAKLEIVAAEGAYRAGRGSQADVFAAHSALAGFEDLASEMGRRVRTAKTSLARWIGDGAEAPLADKPAIGSVRLDTAALDTELSHHPEISVLTRQEQIAVTEARLAQADKNADWSVEVSYAQRGSAYSNMVSVGVSIPLQWDQKNRQNRELASKLALADQAKAKREEALRAHINEVRTMIAEWENGHERLGRYEREIVPLARERTRAALAAYQGGKANLTDLLLARRNEIDVRMKAVGLEAEVARLWGQLNFLSPDSAAMTQASIPVPSTGNHAKESK